MKLGIRQLDILKYMYEVGYEQSGEIYAARICKDINITSAHIYKILKIFREKKWIEDVRLGEKTINIQLTDKGIVAARAVHTFLKMYYE